MKMELQIYGLMANKFYSKGRTLTKGKEHRNYLRIGIYQCCNKQWTKIKPATAYFTHPIAGPTRESLE